MHRYYSEGSIKDTTKGMENILGASMNKQCMCCIVKVVGKLKLAAIHKNHILLVMQSNLIFNFYMASTVCVTNLETMLQKIAC